MISISLDAIIAPSRPVANRVIHIEVSGLLAEDGSAMDPVVTSWYITRLEPHYSTVLRIRMVAGEFLSELPDSTVDQLIQYFSYQADLLNYTPEYSSVNPDTYRNFRSRWVTASVIVSLLSGSSINSLLQKRLGDLMVKRDKPAMQLLARQMKELEDLTEMLQDGGYYGRSAETGSKGVNHPDRPDFGRQWANTDAYDVPSVPIGNTKELFIRTRDGAFETRSKKIYGKR